jgi:hypothetical protein
LQRKLTTENEEGSDRGTARAEMGSRENPVWGSPSPSSSLIEFSPEAQVLHAFQFAPKSFHNFFLLFKLTRVDFYYSQTQSSKLKTA